MRIVEQSHKIISLPENLLETLERAGRTCYKSEDKIGCTTDKYENCMGEWTADKRCHDTYCQYHSSRKFIQTLIKRGHHAMIEFGDIIVRFITNRGVTHEIVRHRLCSFAQESTRYVKYSGKMEFIQPVWLDDNDDGLAAAIWRQSLFSSERKYKQLLDLGWRPEQAREVLPNSLKTEIVVKANIREWRHIFKLRCSKAAHPQMRALMIPVLRECKEKLPVVFNDI